MPNFDDVDLGFPIDKFVKNPTPGTKPYVIICYRQYGEWSATRPFDSLEKAKVHANMYLRSREEGTPFYVNKDYVKDITFLDVELPE